MSSSSAPSHLISIAPRTHLLLFLPLLSLLSSIRPARSYAPIDVELDVGIVHGKKCDYDFDASEFLGVPFAQPPIGELRFRPPLYYDVPYASGSFNATTFPLACGTPCDASGSLTVRQTVGEDCLYLNIYAPLNATGGGLPVRVYIHGGANRACRASDALLTGCAAASASNAVIVVIQYRLGAFGFLAHPQTLVESNTTGNWGVLDQQMALKWVQKNIAAFGGDPDKVVLHGGSSGASSVALQVAIPSSEGLFRAAITQSATCYEALSLNNSYSVQAELTANLNCTSEDPILELDCLRKVEVAAVTNATADYTLDSNCYNRDHHMFSPTIDGNVVPQQVLDAYVAGNINKVPIMFGVNDQEGSFFIDIFFTDTTNISLSELYEFLEEVYVGVDPAEVLTLYPEENYAELDYPMYRRVVDILGDIFVKCPAYNLLIAHYQLDLPTYGYYFSHTPSCPSESVYKGASHGTELPFVFRNLNDLYPPGGNCNLTESEGELADVFNVAWSSMAANGYPSYANGTIWTEWNPQTSIYTVLENPVEESTIDLSKTCAGLDLIFQKSTPLGSTRYGDLSRLIKSRNKHLVANI